MSFPLLADKRMIKQESQVHYQKVQMYYHGFFDDVVKGCHHQGDRLEVVLFDQV